MKDAFPIGVADDPSVFALTMTSYFHIHTQERRGMNAHGQASDASNWLGLPPVGPRRKGSVVPRIFFFL